MSNRRIRIMTTFSIALLVSGFSILGAIVGLILDRNQVFSTVFFLIIAAAWLIPALYAMRYRDALTLYRRTQVSKPEVPATLRSDIDEAQRTINNAVTDSRKKASRHEYMQEQALARIEADIRMLAVKSTTPGKWTKGSRIDAMLVTSNGAGLGHVTRLLAVADKLPSTYQVELLTLSKAYKQVTEPGLTVHYFPSSEAAGEKTQRWNRVFRDYVRDLLGDRHPSVVVFDGTWIYSGLTDVCRAMGIPLVWMQRGMWKTEIDKKSVQRHAAAKVADYVIIPGDYAGTERVEVGSGIEPYYVGPIVRTSRDDLLPREDACRALGLDPKQRYILLNLGGASIGDPSSIAHAALECIRVLVPARIAVQVVSPLDSAGIDAIGLVRVSAYPVMQYARAFDFAISAAGYNSAQEAAFLGTPTILVPNAETKTDDQVRRSQLLEEVGLCVVAESSAELPQAINRLAIDTVRREFSARSNALKAPEGDVEAAAIIDEIRERSAWHLRAETIPGVEDSDG